MRACRDMGIATVAVYSDARPAVAARALRRRGLPRRPQPAGRELPAHRRDHRRRRRRPVPTASTPGYGFLAENEDFAAACRDAGTHLHRSVTGSHRADGQQDRRAPDRHQGRGMPVVPGTETPLPDTMHRCRQSREIAAGIGYPLLVKAVAGGGGKGMRVVERPGRPAPAPCVRRGPRPGSAFGDTADLLRAARAARPAHRGAVARPTSTGRSCPSSSASARSSGGTRR